MKNKYLNLISLADGYHCIHFLLALPPAANTDAPATPATAPSSEVKNI